MMPAIEFIDKKPDELHQKYDFPCQIDVPNPILPIYTYGGKKYIQSTALNKFIPMFGVYLDDYSYVEHTDEEIYDFLGLLNDYYKLNVSVQYLEMNEEQAVLIEEPDVTMGISKH